MLKHLIYKVVCVMLTINKKQWKTNTNNIIHEHIITLCKKSQMHIYLTRTLYYSLNDVEWWIFLMPTNYIANEIIMYKYICVMPTNYNASKHLINDCLAARMCECVHVWLHERANVCVCDCANVRICECVNVWVCKCVVCDFFNVWMCWCAGVCGCANV